MEGKWRWLLITAVAPVAWGATYYVTKEFLPENHPVWGAVIRALPAGLLLLLVRRTAPRGHWWWRSVVLGTLNTGVFFALVYTSAQLLPAGVASTVMAMSPVVMLVLARLLLNERTGVLPLVGAVAGFGGVALMLLDGAAAIDPPGVAAAAAAMLMSAVGFVLTKRCGGGVDVLAL